MKKISLFFLVILMISCNSSKKTAFVSSKYYTDSIYSYSLEEYRLHNVYLPKNFNKNKQYPIIYATDGIPIKFNITCKNELDSLIQAKLTKPFILIESHSNSKIADSTSTTYGNGKKVYNKFRYFDYVPNQTFDTVLKKRFQNHMNYFVSELIPTIEVQLNQKIRKENRIFYGYSNGASFGMNMLNSHPDLIGTYICYSIIGGDVQSMKWNAEVNYPKLYVQYGSYEPEFLKKDADLLINKYEELNLFYDIKSYEGGHDEHIWKKEFIKTIEKILK